MFIISISYNEIVSMFVLWLSRYVASVVAGQMGGTNLSLHAINALISCSMFCLE